MAGRPKRRQIIAELERRAAAECESEAPTALDYAELWVASGRTLAALADDVGRSIGCTVLREQLTRIVHSEEGSAERLTSARASGAHALADESLAIADTPVETRVELAQAELRAKSRQWLAERWNREAYGQAKQAGVAISVSLLHLDALRARVSIVQEIGNPLVSESERGAIAQAIALGEIPAAAELLPLSAGRGADTPAVKGSEPADFD